MELQKQNQIQRTDVQFVKRASVLASYADVQAKAAAIYRSDGVEAVALGATYCEFEVTSISGRTYQTLLSFPSGESSKITDWACECPWSKWNYKRAPKYKKLEHRKCAHALAASYFLLAFRAKVGPALAPKTEEPPPNDSWVVSHE